MKKYLIICVAIAVYSCFTEASAQSIHYVKAGSSGNGTSWADASGDLQLMINASSSGDQVWVAEGTYLPTHSPRDGANFASEGRDNAFLLKKDVKIYGGFKGVANETNLTQRDSTGITNFTILSGNISDPDDRWDNCYHVVISVGDVGTAQLNGFTITGGNSSGTSVITVNSTAIVQHIGGGIRVDNSSPGLNNLILSKNRASIGGGLVNTTNSNPVVKSVAFIQNSCTDQGGGVLNQNSSPVFSYSTFYKDSANEGAGMYNENASPIIDSTTFESNYAGGFGGGIMNKNSTPILTRAIFNKNRGESRGGGLYNYNSTLTLTNTVFDDNHCQATGGGISNNGSTVNITNTIFYNNSCTYSASGGGIYNLNSALNLTNVTFSKNRQALYIDGTPLPKVTNVVFWSNSDSDVYGTATVTYSFTQESISGSHNIQGTSDPFLNINNPSGPDGKWGTSDDGLNLKMNSPAINGGNNIAINATGVLNDISGNSRIYNDTVDMGAYEIRIIKPDNNGILYVNISNTNLTGIGDSWEQALISLEDAMVLAKSLSTVKEIWVAKGTYKPSAGASFSMPEGVKIYGGFAGTEHSIGERILNSANKSYLQGNNSRIIYSKNLTENAMLDGFTISGGQTNSSGGGIYNLNSSALFSNLVIKDNAAANGGGGVYNSGSSSVFTNVVIENNTATNYGGGMANDKSSVKVLNSSFINNICSNSDGGGMANYDCSPELINIVFYHNSAATGGGAVYNRNSPTTITNGSFFDNSAYLGGGVESLNGSHVKITNTIFYGNSSDLFDDGVNSIYTYNYLQNIQPGTGNIVRSVNPFINSANVSGDDGLWGTQDDGLQLISGSDAINSGINDATSISTDITGDTRIREGNIDMGAYEFKLNIIPLPTNGILYVDNTIQGGNGSSWQKALSQLEFALDAAKTNNSIQQIWVAKGNYKPYKGSSFSMVEGVKIYGGFAGNETNLSERILSNINPTILESNGNRVFYNNNNGLTVVSLLDGFTISGGDVEQPGVGMYNLNASPSLSNIIFDNNNSIGSNSSGGGMYNLHSNPSLQSVYFTNNKADYGAGLYNSSSFPTLYNIVFSSNNATINGAGIYNTSKSSPIVVNAVFADNHSNQEGAGICNINSSSEIINSSFAGNDGGVYNDAKSSSGITNSIFWNNDGGAAYHDVYDDQNSSTITYNYSQSELNGVNNIKGTKDPFVSIANAIGNDGIWGTADDGLHLNEKDNYFDMNLSPFNVGNNAYIPSDITTDIAGRARIIYGIVDLGAYEGTTSPPITPANGIVYVTLSGSGNFSGSSWANATNLLQKAIDGANVQQVWVAQGTYKPTQIAGNGTNEINKAFVLKKDVKIFGGFTGINETSLAQRDSTRATNNTILSGDLGVVNDNSDNSLHVVISAGDVGMAELNGFSITGGNAHGFANVYIEVSSMKVYNPNGGGIAISSSSPLLNNLTVYENSAGVGGGIYIEFDNINSMKTDESVSPVIKNTVIRGNTSNDGGGIYNYKNASPILINVIIEQNHANSFGGGIYNFGPSTPILTNVTISGNNATSNSGGMLNNSSSPVLTNVIISGNNSDGDVGGIYNYQSSPILTNVTISGNNAGRAGGIYNNNSSNPKIRNSIIFGNSTGIINEDNVNAPSIPEISYSLVQGLTNSNDGSGNIDGNSDPLFKSMPTFNTAPFAGGDFQLNEASPVINMGNNAYYTADIIPDLSAITTDLDGNDRFSGIIDLGAYEYINPLPVKIINYTAQADGNRAKLKWTTATESNNKVFIISRSADGKKFTEIGRVAGAGNSTLENDYLFYDENPLSGINFYRLEQMDFDGRKTDLGVRTVNFSSVVNNSIKIYPNPVKTSVRIEFATNTYQQVELTDANGKVLQLFSLSTIDTKKKMDMSNLSSGIYFIRLTGNDKVESRKVVKE